MTFRVAVVATACEFPEGRSPTELWSTVLNARRCFRAIPAERLSVDDYATVESDPDGIYPIEAALLEGYKFDRERFRIPQSCFDRTDMAHWLALDVATRALSCLNPAGVAAERDGMAVIVANTLTGEFSRAHALRYRWPYVERAIRTAVLDSLPEADVARLVEAVEVGFKAHLPAPDEDSLAGALSNTIAGRIANYHALRGGAHCVDGACASSLVAITSAYERLAMGDAGCVLVGAVDLSLDPFELVGFARNRALARGLMRVFDKDSDGFWPGEGCGFLVLATEQVAALHGWPVLAWIVGAAMSTDGAGALTRPTVEGQTLAARRAWARAGRDPAEADYFEAHGTGTPTGDPVELAGLAALFSAGGPARPIPVGSIKANIGHTKAAAGMAGLLKAISICQERIIPATTGCIHPHPILDSEVGARIGVLDRAEPVLHDRPIIAGVNSFGFGGVNCHVVLEGVAPAAGFETGPLPKQQANDLTGELFLLAAQSASELADLLDRLERRASSLSRAQLADLSYALHPSDAPAWRACVVARTPQELGTAAAAAAKDLRSPNGTTHGMGQQFNWSAPASGFPRITYLFAGQGSALHLQPLAWMRRFTFLRHTATEADALARQDRSDTAVLQPLLAEVAIAGVEFLRHFNIEADVVLGHSFGELPALYASGQMERDELRMLANRRGACMRDHAPKGAMLALRTSREIALEIAVGYDLDLACENSALRFVLAGDPGRIGAAAAACAARQIQADTLPTTRAFHSRGMAEARVKFCRYAAAIGWLPAQRKMISSITGCELDGSESIAELLTRQITDTVKFGQALAGLEDPDLVLEIGAGPVLAGLAEERFPGRVRSIDVFGDSPLGALAALGSAWVCGAAFKRAPLYEGRLLRPCGLDDKPKFLENPCGLSGSTGSSGRPPRPPVGIRESAPAVDPMSSVGRSALDVLRAAVAELTGLPAAGLHANLRLLADLHLNSIRARHAVALAAQRMGIAKMPFELARFANASLEEAATYLEGLRHADPNQSEAAPAGVAPWVRFYTHEWEESATVHSITGALPKVAWLEDVFAPLPHYCRALLSAPDSGQPGCAILVLPGEGDGAVSAALLQATQRLLHRPDLSGLLVLQGAQLANGFLRSVAAELPERRFCAVEYESLDAAALQAALAEYSRDSMGFGELRLRGTTRQRRSMALAALPAHARPWAPPLRSVLLVSGGGRGIGAVSARALALAYGYKLALIGRSPVSNQEVLRTLSGFHAEGLDARYFQADLTDPLSAREAVEQIEVDLGPVTGLLHAAGINRPMGIGSLDVEEISRTVACKVGALKSLLGCLPLSQLSLVVGYGSVIGELGLAGEAHYAMANEWLAGLLEQLRREAPACRVLHLSWTAWREVGMAVRLDGVLDGLRQAGTRPLDTDEAIGSLLRAVDGAPATALTISGRYGRSLDVEADLPLLQVHRYLERPHVFYPGVELVADALLSSDADRYLQDHAPFGVPLFPLACAIEVMLSAAHCLHPAGGLPTIRSLRVGEGIAFSLGQRFVLRTCALALEDETVQVELRAETTGFEVVHFTGVCSWEQEKAAVPSLPIDGGNNFPADELLYQGLCFHGPRFRRLARVIHLTATECQVQTARGGIGDWYGPFLPKDMVGGAPGVRDAVLHALQLCVPYQVVLPVAAAQVQLGRLDSESEYLISARQTFSDGTRFVFDIEVSDTSRQLVERWHGLELIRSNAASGAGSFRLAPILLGPLIGRLLSDELRAGTSFVGVVLAQRRAVASQSALVQALGNRPDEDPMFVTASHAGDITVALAHREQAVALDLQFAPEYSIEAWCLMLGEERMRFAMQLVEDNLATEGLALLYAWTLSECLIKLGIDGWPLALAGRTRIDTAHIGTVLKFSCAEVGLVVAGLELAGQPAPGALAIGVVATPPSVAMHTDKELKQREIQ